MRTVSKEIYEINELSEDAVDNAYYKWLETHDYLFDMDNQKTLDEFLNIFPVRVTHWEYGGYTTPYIRWEFSDDVCYYADFEAVEELTGNRLRTWLLNNYVYKYLESPKVYWGKGLKKKRFSRVQNDNSCVLTGYYLDDEILRPLYDFIDKPDDDSTLEDIMDRCLNQWVKVCQDDYEGVTSKEYFIEESIELGWEYYEDGSRY